MEIIIILFRKIKTFTFSRRRCGQHKYGFSSINLDHLRQFLQQVVLVDVVVHAVVQHVVVGELHDELVKVVHGAAGSVGGGLGTRPP